MNPGPIERFMSADHVRLDRLLRASLSKEGEVDDEAYTAFRGGLLRHIGMEEKVLLPYARARRSGVALPVSAALRADHSVIAKLLVRSPTVALIAELERTLARHNTLEEGAVGLYALCDVLAAEEAPAVVARLEAQPSVPLARYYDGPLHRRP
jgi:hypothetical protein